MALFTISPWVLLALILALLLIILLAAFSRKIAANILWFFGGVLDLYQRWLQLLPHTQRASTSEQGRNDAQQNHSPRADREPVAADTAYALSTLQPQAALQQQPKVSDTMGEQ
jgi:disulfide bond formation protein DsbB